MKCYIYSFNIQGTNGRARTQAWANVARLCSINPLSEPTWNPRFYPSLFFLVQFNSIAIATSVRIFIIFHSRARIQQSFFSPLALYYVALQSESQGVARGYRATEH